MSIPVRSRRIPVPLRKPAQRPLPPAAQDTYDQIMYPGYTRAGDSKHSTVYVNQGFGPPGLQFGRIMSGIIDVFHEHLQNIFFCKCMTTSVKTNLLVTGFGQGAYHITEYGTDIYATCTTDFDPYEAAFMYCAEFAEVLAAYSGRGWLSEDSHGEALSRVVAEVVQPGKGSAYTSVHYYLNKGYYLDPVKADWITQSKPSETDGPSIAAGVCFLYYLHSQLGYAWADIVATPGNSLEEKFQRLTGRKNGYLEMRAVLARKYFPADTPMLVGDNPFPIH